METRSSNISLRSPHPAGPLLATVCLLATHLIHWRGLLRPKDKRDRGTANQLLKDGLWTPGSDLRIGKAMALRKVGEASITDQTNCKRGRLYPRVENHGIMVGKGGHKGLSASRQTGCSQGHWAHLLTILRITGGACFSTTRSKTAVAQRLVWPLCTDDTEILEVLHILYRSL